MWFTDYRSVEIVLLSWNINRKLIWCSRITEEEYVKAIQGEISSVVKLQEELDIDVLVHGEPEVHFYASSAADECSNDINFKYMLAHGWVKFL